jgi:hypothetical protein
VAQTPAWFSGQSSLMLAYSTETMKVQDFQFEQQKEPDLVKLPTDFDFDSILEKAEILSHHYGVIFAQDGKVFGSGTLVTANGIHGILTAHHVAIIPYLREGEEFCFCIRDDMAHCVDANTSQFQHVFLGDSRRNRFEHSGPDLSFLMITDPKLLATLSSKKSFYPLVRTTDFSQCPPDKLRQYPCFVSGSPQELSTDMGIYKGERLTKFVHLQLPGVFRSLKQKQGFDYLRLEVWRGIRGFPKEYGGVSGGGIWVPVAQEMKTADVDFYPVLQGVVFYESCPYNGEGGPRRLLIGHGPDSIYRLLLQKLKTG